MLTKDSSGVLSCLTYRNGGNFNETMTLLAMQCAISQNVVARGDGQDQTHTTSPALSCQRISLFPHFKIC